MLTVSALAYLLSRLGFFYRTRTHHRASRAILDQFFDVNTPTLTTIIPSYAEDERVIRNTLLSAALQEYPGKRVVLLIADPFVPKNAKAREQLEERILVADRQPPRPVLVAEVLEERDPHLGSRDPSDEGRIPHNDSQINYDWELQHK